MAKFEAAVTWTLKHEGVLSNDSSDRGGLTKYGITEEEAKRYGLDVRTLSIEQAKSIYRAGYWRHDDLGSQRVATKAFDTGVNVGVVRGVQLLQRAANRVLAGQEHLLPGDFKALTIDGLLGPKTELRINSLVQMDERAFLEAMKDVQVLYYADIIDGNADELEHLVRIGKVPRDFKVQGTFAKGWMARAIDIPE